MNTDLTVLLNQMTRDFYQDFAKSFNYSHDYLYGYCYSFDSIYKWKLNEEGNQYILKIKYPGYNKNTIKVKVTPSVVRVETTDGKLHSDLSVNKDMDMKSLKAVALDGILTLTVSRIPDTEVTVE